MNAQQTLDPSYLPSKAEAFIEMSETLSLELQDLADEVSQSKTLAADAAARTRAVASTNFWAAVAVGAFAAVAACLCVRVLL